MMKKIFLVSLCVSLLIAVFMEVGAEEINKGDPKKKVLSILGEPDGYMKVGEKEYMVYGSKEVVLKDGKVIRSTVDLDRDLAVPEVPAIAPREEAGPVDFDDVDIHSVPIAPFLDEARNKVDVTRHSTYRNMPRYEGNYRHIVDPFYFKRDRGEAPTYRYRQFITSKSLGEIINWYKTEASSSLGGKGGAFAYGSWFSNGPFDDSAANVGVNNGRNFIQVTAMKGAGDDRTTVYIFHYRTAPPPTKAPARSRNVTLRRGMLVDVKRGSQWLGGKIVKIDMSRDKPYYVEFTGYVDYFEWHSKNTLRPRER